MICAGLTSITFRKLAVPEIIAATAEAGLEGIEWGADVHVPPGDLRHAQETHDRTEEAGLEVSSYGSYYRLGGGADFEPILEAGAALGAPTIRVWAGGKASGECSEQEFEQIAADARNVGEMAAAAGLNIGLELHAGTLTDSADAARRLMERVSHAQVRLYWQPYHHLTPEENLATIDLLGPFLSNVHVFHWDRETTRFPLAEGASRWSRYLESLAEAEVPRWALLEFAVDDRLAAFREDAAVLRRLLAGFGEP